MKRRFPGFVNVKLFSKKIKNMNRFNLTAEKKHKFKLWIGIMIAEIESNNVEIQRNDKNDCVYTENNVLNESNLQQYCLKSSFCTVFTFYLVILNYTIGIGYLAIPYAFQQSGIIFGSLIVVFASLILYHNVLMLAESSQQEMQLRLYFKNPYFHCPEVSTFRFGSVKSRNRSRSIEVTEAKQGSKQDYNLAALYSKISKIIRNSEKAPILNGSSSKACYNKSKKTSRSVFLDGDVETKEETDEFIEDNDNEGDNSYDENPFDNCENERSEDNNNHLKELEVNDLANEFLGFYGKLTYELTLIFLTYAGLLAYTQVFNSCFISQIWPTAPTFAPPLLFLLLVIPLSCFDVAEHVSVQLVMSILRFLSLLVLFLGTIFAIFVDPLVGRKFGFNLDSSSSFKTQSSHNLNYVVNNYYLKHIIKQQTFQISSNNKFFNVETATSISPLLSNYCSGFGIVFTIIIFSQLFQHSVPALIRPLSDDLKKQTPTIFKYALFTSTIIYIAIGCACVICFGDNVNQFVNLNFVAFQWGMQATNNEKKSFKMYLISFFSSFVVCFPACDSISMFPMLANKLASNLAKFFQTNSKQMAEQSFEFSTSSTAKSTKLKVYWIIIASLPPIVASLFIKNLIFSLQIAGLCGIIVALIIPALLKRKSQFRVSLIPLIMQTKTAFSISFSSPMYTFLVLSLGFISFLIAIFQIVTN
jgi:amino acid permease